MEMYYWKNYLHLNDFTVNKSSMHILLIHLIIHNTYFAFIVIGQCTVDRKWSGRKREEWDQEMSSSQDSNLGHPWRNNVIYHTLPTVLTIIHNS